MATVTPNFNWPVPTSTDLVKDGATAIEALGDSIDASLVDLKGGTSGQVLSKNSNTDMDFVWVTSDDANAIQNTIVDAKGDLITATAADTPARLAVGANGETLVADSSTSTGLRWQGDYAAGKNKIINGAFNVWQRGTTFSPATATPIYSADRFTGYANFSAGTYTVSQQAFTAGTAPVAGYESQYFLRHSFPTSGTISYAEFGQKIEDVRTFAGQTVTLSFWAKASSALTSPTFTITQNFGSGGSGSVSTGSYAPTLSTSWTRYSVTVTLPSIAGKTIGTNNFLYVQYFTGSVATSTVLDFWGWQLEAGSVATAFQTATGTLQGELSACQRYYWNWNSGTNGNLGIGRYTTGTEMGVFCQFPVTMRIAPSLVVVSGTNYYSIGADNFNSFTIYQPTTTTTWLYNGTEVSGTSGVTDRVYTNNAAASVSFSAEL
jgi:hypothetical protein